MTWPGEQFCGFPNGFPVGAGERVVNLPMFAFRGDGTPAVESDNDVNGLNMHRWTFADAATKGVYVPFFIENWKVADGIRIVIGWWTTSGAGDVAWRAKIETFADTDAVGNFATVTLITDTRTGDRDMQIAEWSAPATAGTQNNGPLFGLLRIQRRGSDVLDTLVNAANLVAAAIIYPLV